MKGVKEKKGLTTRANRSWRNYGHRVRSRRLTSIKKKNDTCISLISLTTYCLLLPSLRQMCWCRISPSKFSQFETYAESIDFPYDRSENGGRE